MTTYNPNEPSRQPNQRSVLRWLAYYKPMVVEIETDMGERHRLVIDQKNTKRWAACYANMISLHACVARCLDSQDNVLDTMAIAPKPVLQAEEAPSVSIPATNTGVDVAAILNTFAEALSRTVERVADRIVDAQKVAYSELTAIAKTSNERALISERERIRALDDRERRIEEEEDKAAEDRARREEEREREEREREQEREEMGSLKEMMQPLLAAAAPSIVESLTKKKTVKIEAVPVPDPAKASGT
jgi:hypothetical protein